ncbi:MAG: alginate export family protein [Acidobacteria bacterium]|nr:alginate export family protein [Acidobacteriota bacterium]
MRRILLSFGMLLWVPALESAVEGETDRRWLEEGKWNADLRYRFEWVDQDGKPEDAEASTLRLRLGFTTGITDHGFFGMVEFEGLQAVGNEEYDSTANGQTQFPVVADPEDEEVNQAFLGYSGIRETLFQAGRQRITLDNHRFIGNVGWRQLEQTYDAFTVGSTPTPDLTLFYGHLNNANRVFGEHNPTPGLAEFRLGGDLLNLAYRFPAGTLTGYAYLLEFEDVSAASHKNLGFRFDGKHPVRENLDLLYAAEFADQSDYRDAPATVDARYLLVEGGVRLRAVTLKAGRELLGGDGIYAFQTPLATLHALNGWADKFLVTPPDGLEDLYLYAAATVGGFRLAGAVHDFGADAGGADYGTEIDLSLEKPFREIYAWGLKYAGYDSDGFATDTDKAWAWLSLRTP